MYRFSVCSRTEKLSPVKQAAVWKDKTSLAQDFISDVNGHTYRVMFQFDCEMEL